jgi:hypothetical protein
MNDDNEFENDQDDQADVVRRKYALDAEIEKAENGDRVRGYYCYSATELVANFSEPKFLVEGMLPQHGIACVVGDAGIGKTRIVYDLIRAVLHGEPWLGKSKPARKGGVLLLDHEMGPELVAQRLRQHKIDNVPGERFAIYSAGPNELNQAKLAAEDPNAVRLKGKNEHRPPDHLRLPAPRPNDEEEYLLDPRYETYIEMLAAQVDAKVIVFDSMRHSHMAEENASHLMAPLMDTFRRLGRNRLVILIHHAAKRKNDEEMMSARGSTEILASLDVLIEVQKGGAATDNSMTWTKVRGWEVLFNKVTYNKSTLVITSAPEKIPGLDFITTTTRAIVRVLEENGPLLAEDILASLLGKAMKTQKDFLTIAKLWEVINVGVEKGVFEKRRVGRDSKKSAVALCS